MKLVTVPLSVSLILYHGHGMGRLPPVQEFGSPTKNGLGHRVTKTTDPLTCQLVDAVFMPKLKAGMWNGEISNHSFVSSSEIVDDDCTALRKNQLHLDCRLWTGRLWTVDKLRDRQ